MSDTTNPEPSRKAEAEPNTTLVYTRCIFFLNQNTTVLERQVNYFLTYAPLAALHKMETNVTQDGVLVTLWFEPMPGALHITRVYEEALGLDTL